MLLQKYRPNSLEGIVGNRFAAQQLKRAIVNSQKVVLTGPPGCGKSLALQIIAKEMKYHLQDEDPEDLLKSSKQRSMWYNGKILVADLDAWGAKECLELKKCSWPVVFVAADIYDRKLLTARKAVPTIIRFKKIGWSDTVNFLEKICRQEDIIYDRPSLGEVAKIADGDLRWCLLILEGAGKVDANFVKQLDKEKVQGIFDVLDSLFIKKEVSARIEDLPWVLANLAECYNGANLAFAYDCVALADYFRAKPGGYFESFLSLLPRSVVRPQYKTPMWIGRNNSELREIAAQAHCSFRKSASYKFLLED